MYAHSNHMQQQQHGVRATNHHNGIISVPPLIVSSSTSNPNDHHATTTSQAASAKYSNNNNNNIRQTRTTTSTKQDSRPRQGGITITFPMKLHAMLCDLQQHGNTHHEASLSSSSPIICWNDTGDAFVISKPKDFTQILLPKYFRTKKFSSFQRQLNAYGFVRGNLYAGQEDMHIYHHEIFHRDRADRLYQIKRRGSLGGTNAAAAKNSSTTTDNKPTRRRTFYRGDANASKTTATTPVMPDTATSTNTAATTTSRTKSNTPIMTPSDFDVMMADLASDVPSPKRQQEDQSILIPLPFIPRASRHSQQQSLQHQVQQQHQLQQQFNSHRNTGGYNNSYQNNSFNTGGGVDSVLDEAVAAVVTTEDARSLYAGLLTNWNTDEERLWSDTSSN